MNDGTRFAARHQGSIGAIRAVGEDLRRGLQPGALPSLDQS